jgi:hypothetical protein
VSPAPVFFTDRDLGKKFPEILRAAGPKVERHADHFRQDTLDVAVRYRPAGATWLRQLG